MRISPPNAHEATLDTAALPSNGCSAPESAVFYSPAPTPPAGVGGTKEGGVRVSQTIPMPGRRGARRARRSRTCARRREDHRQGLCHPPGRDGPTTVACSTNNRQQNEPAAAVSPTQPNKMTAGANDYCTTPTNGDAWAGFYYSSDSGANWTNSLLPGYPNDTTAEGTASPLHRPRARRRRPRAGVGPVRQRLLRRDRIQPRQTCERVDLGRPLQLDRGRDARLPAHRDRVARHAEPDLPRPLPRQGDDRGRPE